MSDYIGTDLEDIMDPIDEDDETGARLFHIEPNDILWEGLSVLVYDDEPERQLVPRDWQAPQPKTLAEVPDCDWEDIEEMARA